MRKDSTSDQEIVNDNDNNLQDNSNNTTSNPLSLPFDQSWYFNISLNKSEYSLGEHLYLTVNLTSLIDHNSSYILGMNRDIQIKNSTGDIGWSAFSEHSNIYYENHFFPAGYDMSKVMKLYLSETTNRSSSDDIMSWIPALPLGSYRISIRPPYGETFDSVPTLSLPFTIQ